MSRQTENFVIIGDGNRHTAKPLSYFKFLYFMFVKTSEENKGEKIFCGKMFMGE